MKKINLFLIGGAAIAIIATPFALNLVSPTHMPNNPMVKETSENNNEPLLEEIDNSEPSVNIQADSDLYVVPEDYVLVEKSNILLEYRDGYSQQGIIAINPLLDEYVKSGAIHCSEDTTYIHFYQILKRDGVHYTHECLLRTS